MVRSTTAGAHGAVVLVAAPGYGRTTALEAAAEDRPATTLLAPARDLVAAPFAADLTDVLVDDLDDLDEPGRTALAGRLAALPAEVRLTLATSRPLSPAVRAALHRPLLVRTAADLALSAEQAARVLREEHGVDDLDVAEAVHRATAGWPVLVHLAAHVAAEPGTDAVRVRARLEGADSPCRHWLADHVLARLDATSLEVLDVAVRVGPVAPALLASGDGEGHAAAVRHLVATGLLVPAVPTVAVVGGPARGADDADLLPVTAVPALAAAVRAERPAVTARVVADRAAAAAAWFGRHGRHLVAVRLLHTAGDVAGAAAVVARHGDALLAGGGAADLVTLADDLLTDPGAGGGATARRLRLVLGDAHRMAGDAPAALRTFRPLVEDADRSGRWTADLAWRLAMVHYMTGYPGTALEVCRRVPETVRHGAEEDGDAADAVLLATAQTSALLATGGAAGIGPLVDAALARAERCGDPRISAAAHLVAAGAGSGRDREEHLRLASAAAVDAGDLVTLARVLVNRTFTALAAARFTEAAELGAAAVRTAEAGAPPGILVMAQTNLGTALFWVGRFDSARFHFGRALLTARRAGLSTTAVPLVGVGTVALALGRREQARMAFDEAVETARASGSVRVEAEALLWLAELSVEEAAERPAALDTAADLMASVERLAPPGLDAERARVSCRLALARGDLAAAVTDAARALDHARAARAVPEVAAALEAVAASSRDAATARAALEEAYALWSEAGASPSADRVLVRAGRLPGTTSRDRAAARDAAARLAAFGVRVPDGGALPGQELTAPLQVRVLGGFEVVAGGRPVPFAAWRSRQARTLVKILVARRGRPVPRGEICELLWPDDDPQRTAHRLSVLLSAVRGVLDPAKAWPPDRYVRADATGLSLDLANAVVDAVELLRDAAHAEQVLADGDEDRALLLFAEVDALHQGDAFDDEPYEAWADGLREEVRAAWLRSLRRHARLARRAGDVDGAVGDLVRLLVADPYDESAHHALVRTLVAARRHGEARRAFDRWAHAMESIDAPPPDPDVLAAVRRAPSVAPSVTPSGRPPVIRLPDGEAPSRSVL